MHPRRHLDLQCMFHLPFIRPFVFVSPACSGGVPAKTVFEYKNFLHDNTEYDKS